MKSFTLIFDGIAEKYRRSKVLFILMIVGILVSDFMMIYFYGNYNAYLDSTVGGISGRTYHADNNLKLTIEEIDKLDFSEYDVQTYGLSCGWSNYDEEKSPIAYIDNGNGSIQTIAYSSPSGRESLSIQAYKNDVFYALPFVGKVDFSGETAPYVAILPCTDVTKALKYDSETNSYGTVYISEKPYKIIGVSTDLYSLFIPYETFIQEGYEAARVEFVTNSVLSLKQSDKFESEIYDAFGSSEKKSPYSEYKSVEDEYKVYVALIFIAYTVSLISFAFFMSYFTELGKRTTSIYSLCGAGKLHLMANTLAQNLLLTVSGCVVALIFNLIFGNLINFLPSVSYSLRDAVVMLASVVLATVIMSVPSVLKVRRAEAKDLCRAAV